MDIRKQVTFWVEEKFGTFITKNFKNKIQGEEFLFETEPFVNNLFDLIFKEKSADEVKNEILNFERRYDFSRSDSGLSKEIYRSNSLDSLVLEQNDFANFSTTELINDLQSGNEGVKLKSLKTLDVIAEDLINQTSWQKIIKVLQGVLEGKVNRKHQILVLKVLLKFMTCPSRPQIVCESFISVTEVVSYHIGMSNSKDRKIFYEEIYDFKEDKWLKKNKTFSPSKKTVNVHLKKSQQCLSNEVLIKCMWLLLECQKQMPEKWIRFNEKRLREIVFSFVSMLASTSDSEMEKFSGLEVLSTLNPSASWCRHWCHTALGRTLLCSALRKHKNFFTHMVEIVLTHIKVLGSKLQPIIKQSTENHEVKLYLNRTSENKKHSGNSEDENPEFSSAYQTKERTSLLEIKNLEIRQKIINQATFCHCVSLLVFLIQFRSGRALFPVQTSIKKRSITVQDFIQSVMSFLENSEYDVNEVSLTHDGQQVFLELLRILRQVRMTIQSSRKSAERPMSTFTSSSFHL